MSICFFRMDAFYTPGVDTITSLVLPGTAVPVSWIPKTPMMTLMKVMMKVIPVAMLFRIFATL